MSRRALTFIGILVVIAVADAQQSGLSVPSVSIQDDAITTEGDKIVRGFVDFRGHDKSGVVVLQDRMGSIRKYKLAIDGRFEFKDVADGAYNLRVTECTWYIPRVVLHVSSGYVISATEMDPKQGRAGITSLKSLILTIKHPYAFFSRKPPFPFQAYLKSPIFLVICVGILSIFAFPRFVESMDDKTLEDITGEKRPAVNYPNDTFRQLAD